MRDYPGSSRFSPEELKAIASSDRETQAKAIKALGLQISAFLVHIIKKCDIPKFTEENGKKKGGLALLGWSLGNLVSMSMLGNAGTLPDDTKDFLERYLRTVVMYGACLKEKLHGMYAHLSGKQTRLTRHLARAHQKGCIIPFGTLLLP